VADHPGIRTSHENLVAFICRLEEYCSEGIHSYRSDRKDYFPTRERSSCKVPSFSPNVLELTPSIPVKLAYFQCEEIDIQVDLSFPASLTTRSGHFLRYMLSGHATVKMKGGSEFHLQPGDSCFLGGGVAHSFQPDRGSRFFVLRMRDRGFGSSIADQDAYQIVSSLSSRSRLKPILHCTAPTQTQLYRNLRRASAEASTQARGWHIALKGIVLETLLLLARDPRLSAQFTAQKTVYPLGVRKALAYIDQHLQSEVRIRHVLEAAGMSRSHFYRTFRNVTGLTFADHLARKRVARATRMLRETDQTVTAIAFECGFGSLSAMYASFHRVLAVAPGEIRRLERQASSS